MILVLDGRDFRIPFWESINFGDFSLEYISEDEMNARK
jgi:hypothetical protein